jgi:hypothetical protein
VAYRDELPSWYGEAASIINNSADAGFAAGNAYAQALTEYLANRASHSVTLMVQINGSTLATVPSGPVSDSHLIPGDYSLLAANVSVPVSECGNTAIGNSAHAAWNEFITSGQSLLSWGRVDRQSTHSASQPECQLVDDSTATTNPPGGGGGGGGEGGGGTRWYMCYWLVTYVIGTEVSRQFLGCHALTDE